MKTIDSIISEINLFEDKESFIKKKEFLELANHIEDDEKILDINFCQKVIPKRVNCYGLLVLTSKRILFLSLVRDPELYKFEESYSNLKSTKLSKGFMLDKIQLYIDSRIEEFDYVQKKTVTKTLNILDAKRKEYIELKKEELTKEENSTELSVLEKLKFKKFISEQGGISVGEVDEYLNSISIADKDELILSFKSQEKVNTSKEAPIQTNTTINYVQESSNTNPRCPKCKSRETTFNKEGFGVGKAAVGAILTGGIGLLAGGIGKNKIRITCMKCGHTWTAG